MKLLLPLVYETGRDGWLGRWNLLDDGTRQQMPWMGRRPNARPEEGFLSEDLGKDLFWRKCEIEIGMKSSRVSLFAPASHVERGS